jgi:HlyD family secretion protein
VKKKTVIILGSVVVLAFVLAFIFFRPHAKNSLAQYDFSSVNPMNLSEEVDATGKVLALEKKEVYPDFDGTVEQINVQAGASVKKGDPLLTIKSTSLNSQWQQANTELKQARINLSQASAELATELALNKVSKNNALQIETYSHQISLYKSQVKQAEKDLNDLNARNDSA